ncbi:alpha/beta hydrolase [Emcibacter nanhaiensis]|nr:alpha/beta hydrolase-fold protein [Emcibacter nanhaiensis]
MTHIKPGAGELCLSNRTVHRNSFVIWGEIGHCEQTSMLKMRGYNMKVLIKFVSTALVLLVGNVQSVAGTVGQQVVQEAGAQKSYAMPRTQVVPVPDTKADRQYELYVKLPEDYQKNTDLKYPVIYTTDAIWHMDMLSGATDYLMPDVILVGISWQKDLDGEVAYASRFRDYSLEKVAGSKTPRGEAANHLSFIRDDVIKYVEDNYRADPGERTYFGYSLGGVFGAYVLLAEPETFKHYILGSPALGPRSAKYLDALEGKMAPRQKEFNANVFLSIGELEKSQMEVTKDLVSVLQRRSQAGLTLTGLEVMEDSDHGTAFPVTVIRSIKWLSQQSSE